MQRIGSGLQRLPSQRLTLLVRSWRHWLGILFLCVSHSLSAEEITHPLKPLDLSSPYATLNSFLATGDELQQYVNSDHWHSPSREFSRLAYQLNAEAISTLDMSQTAPASRFDEGRDVFHYLYDVLSKIRLPAAEDIPGARQVQTAADLGKDTEHPRDPGASTTLQSWTIPHTEITLALMEQGPDQGKYLFSADTVANAKVYYEKLKDQPYQRPVPLPNYPEKRHYLAASGWLFSGAFITGLPNWLKLDLGEQALWKWLVLLVIISLYSLAIGALIRLSRGVSPEQPIKRRLMQLIPPIALLLFTQRVEFESTLLLTLTGWVSKFLAQLAEVVTFFSLAWSAWLVALVIEEVIIASPRIPPSSPVAHLLRIGARTVAIGAIVGMILYASSQLGAPVYSLVAGLGIGGVVIALAAQGTVENYLGGINLLTDCPVRVGDFCRYGTDENESGISRCGWIEGIGLRSTRIRGLDHTITTIPNAEFSKMHIINYSIQRSFFLRETLRLRYETTADQLRYILATMREMLIAHPRVEDEEPEVRFNSFGDYSLNIEIRCSINTHLFPHFRAIREDILFRLMGIIEESGSGVAFPSQALYQAENLGLDQEKQQEAEHRVRQWCAAQELPFPNFAAEFIKKRRNTLYYPPEGSPDADN